MHELVGRAHPELRVPEELLRNLELQKLTDARRKLQSSLRCHLGRFECKERKMKYAGLVFATIVVASPTAFSTRQSSSDANTISDISVISNYWGEIRPYADNNETYFGVEDVGLPDSCQVEQVHLLERHGSRFATGYFDDGLNNDAFASALQNFSMANASAEFTGPLSFLNGYAYQLGSGLLVGRGASQSFDAGVAFWRQYGRTIYNATKGQLAYNASYENGTARTKPVLRTTSQSRIWNSQINWALGFFGTSYEKVPNPTLANATSPFELVVIEEGGTENNTLASYDSCTNADNVIIGSLGDYNLEYYMALYLQDARDRLAQYVPDGFNLTINSKLA